MCVCIYIYIGTTIQYHNSYRALVQQDMQGFHQRRSEAPCGHGGSPSSGTLARSVISAVPVEVCWFSEKPQRPHQDKDDIYMLVLRPKTGRGGAPETMQCRVLVFIWSSWAHLHPKDHMPVRGLGIRIRYRDPDPPK